MPSVILVLASRPPPHGGAPSGQHAVSDVPDAGHTADVSLPHEPERADLSSWLPVGATHAVRHGAGGLEHPPATFPGHLVPQAHGKRLLKLLLAERQEIALGGVTLRWWVPDAEGGTVPPHPVRVVLQHGATCSSTHPGTTVTGIPRHCHSATISGRSS